MKTILRTLFHSPIAAGLLASISLAQDFEYGDPGMRSMSVLAFDPDGVLFVGDGVGGAVFALDIDPGEPTGQRAPIEIVDVEAKLAARLGTTPNEVMVHDMAVHPVSGRLFLSVSRGRSGWDTRWQTPNDVANAEVLLTIDPAGKIEEVPLEDVGHARVALPNPVAEGKAHSWKQGVQLRSDTITDIAYVDGTLFVTGLSNEEFASTLWRIPFPFQGKPEATTLEIFHGAHGAYETFAPIRTFVPYRIGGEPHVLAAYLCTPLVTFPVDDLKPGAHARGRTLAELGSGNYPLDMVVYKNAGRERLLIANSNLPFMVVKPEDIEAFEGSITTRPEGYLAGVPYEPRSGTGIQQLAVLSDQHLVALQRLPGGTLDLVTFPTNRF